MDMMEGVDIISIIERSSHISWRKCPLNHIHNFAHLSKHSLEI